MKEIFTIIIAFFIIFIIGVLFHKFLSYLGLKIFKFSEIYYYLKNKKKN